MAKAYKFNLNICFTKLSNKICNMMENCFPELSLKDKDTKEK